MTGLSTNIHTVQNTCRSPVSKPLRIVLIIVGMLSLVLGIVGIFLPVLPTVPFVLLAAACFSRGSKKMHHWLVRIPFAGKVIGDYEKGRGVSRRTKVTALLMLWTGMTISAIALGPKPAVLALLLMLAVGTTIIIVRLPKRQDPTI